MHPAGVYGFGPFEFDVRTRHLKRAGQAVPLTDRQATLLEHLVTQPGGVLSKDALITLVWGDVAVTDNSLEQLVSALRRILKDDDGRPYVENVPRQGYRFAGEVSRLARRESDEALDALLAPHRAWIEGRAALESLDTGQIAGTRAAFEHIVAGAPDQASAHVGLANACVMQFETTRADAAPDVAALGAALHHAREACRLDPQLGEGWATLGFVLGRTGPRLDALAAGRRAVTLEPDNWRHQLRLASIGWGEERLRAARRTLALLPGFPLAHYLAATVHVARQAFEEATRELQIGVSAQGVAGAGGPRASGVALRWLLGLIHLSRREDEAALAAFEGEIALEASGHLYARECAANAWYAIGVLRFRQGLRAEAQRAFGEAVSRVPKHPMARVGLGCLDPSIGMTTSGGLGGGSLRDVGSAVDAAIAIAAARARGPDASAQAARDQGDMSDAARHVDAALAAAEPGQAGWLLPVEPLLDPASAPETWAPVLARLQARAA